MERVAIATRSFSRLINIICTMCAQSRVQTAPNSKAGVDLQFRDRFKCDRVQLFSHVPFVAISA